ISLGTVTNVDEGVRWLGYTYLFVRMKMNPLVYGMNYLERENDPELGKQRRKLIVKAASTLHKIGIIKFYEVTDYLRHCQSSEFADLKSREEEQTTAGKVNILLQACLSNANVENFALISDSAFVVQNTSRIVRALFEIALNRNWAQVSSTLLELCKCIDKQDMIDMSSAELGQLVKQNSMNAYISKLTLSITPDFVWNNSIHGSNLKKLKRLGSQFQSKNYLLNYIFVSSDRWIGAETFLSVSLNHLVLPENYHQHTELLSLPPLPITALKNKSLEEICVKKFNHFNPVQTQVFDTFYNSSSNVLIGVPTGSGQTVTVELAMWWAFCEHPRSKIVYIAPLKALVRERIDDWQARLTGPMKEKRLVDLTGDVTPDLRSIENADIIITTPEKWDGISRSWQHKSYVQIVSLVIIDEIHLLSGDRGPILEDLADWLCIDEGGLFNFSHSVRPVSLDISIKGFSERHYCSRMATMNY
ncbi:7508_t:CDS:2, partial [Funneliformis geosporum]